MGLLTGRGIYHPRYIYHGTPVIESAMVTRVDIYEPISGASEPVWDSATGDWLMPDHTPVWSGMARVMPNKDWRAREREWGLESVATHALRVQINVLKNMLVPSEQWPATDPGIRYGYILRVRENRADPELSEYQFTVRNAIGASNNWERTLLCDVNLKGVPNAD